MALRDKKDMQRQLLASGITFIGLIVVVPLFVMFTVSKPTPTIAQSAISPGGNCDNAVNYYQGRIQRLASSPATCRSIAQGDWRGDESKAVRQMEQAAKYDQCADQHPTAQGRAECDRQFPVPEPR